MTVHVGPFYNLHSPVVLLVHGNTRNHVKSHLEMTCKMVAQNQTSGLLAAAEEENQLGLHWPFKVDSGSALWEQFLPRMAGGVLGKATARNHQ